MKYLEENFQKGGVQPSLYFQLAAYHSEFGEEYDKSPELYEKLGDNAKERYAHHEAMNSYAHAIEHYERIANFKDKEIKIE